MQTFNYLWLSSYCSSKWLCWCTGFNLSRTDWRWIRLSLAHMDESIRVKT